MEARPELARDFYKHMAITVTQRLSVVSAASAEIPEAPRGAVNDDHANQLFELSAGKLLKVRRRLNIPDKAAMACMMKGSMVAHGSKSKKHGTLYVFETLVGFVYKVFE